MKLVKQFEEEGKTPFFPWAFSIFDKWIQIKAAGKSLTMYFEDNLITTVAIYGLGSIGKRLYEELVKEYADVCYGIDKNAENIRVDGLTVMTLEGNLSRVDAVIVTPISFYEIREEIYQKMGRDIEVIFIEDVVNYCFDKINRG